MMLKITSLLVGLLATSALADVSSVFDGILSETRGRLPDETDYRPLHYADKFWNSKTREFINVADLEARNGHLLLGSFKREGVPVLFGNSEEGILESRFLIDFKVQYDNFTAVNFTSGEKSEGSMSVSYDVAEMFTWIKMNKKGDQCQTEVSTYTPISMSDPVAVFTTSSPALPQRLFSEAKFTLNFYVNQTLVIDGLPIFADVVSKYNNKLCSLMH